jgi:anthranilate phosphoribosyltransferase
LSISKAIAKTAEGIDLTAAEMEAAMRSIMLGEATAAQIAGLLMALRMKGESVEEIASAAAVMREFAVKVDVGEPNLVDIVGTGGDCSNTFNISTTSAFVLAAAGGKVAKHNNRSVSSRCGSADVLESAGVRINLTPEQVARCVREVGVGFMFAPAHHGATRHAAGPRRELGVRTLFNLLGPLTNPALVPNQLIGVFSEIWLMPIAQVMQKLGSRHVLVVHSEDGMDEISISAPTAVAELRNGALESYTIAPEQFGLQRGPREAISAGNVTDSLRLMNSVLANAPSPARDVVLLNAGAAIYVSGLAPDLGSGVKLADKALSSGGAEARLAQLRHLTTEMADGN